MPIMRFDQSKILWRSSCGHAHELGDGLQRELGRDVDDEVALAALDHVVDDEAGLGAQALFEQSDHARREALVDEEPVPRVSRRIHVQHHLAHHVALGRDVGDADAVFG